MHPVLLTAAGATLGLLVGSERDAKARQGQEQADHEHKMYAKMIGGVVLGGLAGYAFSRLLK